MTIHNRQFSGRRFEDGSVVVFCDDRPLITHYELSEADEDYFFEWGYEGRGPRHLAAAIVAEVEGDDLTETMINRFYRKVITQLPQGGAWKMQSAEVLEAIEQP